MAPKKKKPEATTLEQRVELRMSGDEKKEFQKAAQKNGLTLSHWLRLAAWQTIDTHNGHVKLRILDH